MDINKAVSQPSTVFKEPKEILEVSELSKEQKIHALENWKETCIQLQNCNSEGMTGALYTDQFSKIADAMDELG